MKKRKSSRTRLDFALAAVETPLFLLDERRKLIFFNRGCEALTGWTAGDALGRICDYASKPDPENIESLACNLCPPPEVYSGEPMSIDASIAHRDGTTRKQTVSFFPLLDGGRVVYVLGAVTGAGRAIVPGPKKPRHALHSELSELRHRVRQRYGVHTLVCRSEPMARVLAQIKLARSCAAPMHLEGENGTGKEHVARAIHGNDENDDGAFVPLDCRRMRAVDLKLTLRRLLKRGNDARGGGRDPETESGGGIVLFEPRTLYLAHVESLPRDLQEFVVSAFEPGRNGPRNPLRLLTSSTASLRQALDDDTVRSDFYYLATAVQIELPPLRRRLDDLALLGQAMLEDLNRLSDKQVAGFAEDVWARFRQYNWPGNLDELYAVVKEARDACTGETIRAGHLPFRFRAGMDAQAVGPKPSPAIVHLEQLLVQVELEHIQRALDQAGHNKTKAARLLGMTRTRLYRRMQSLGIADVEGDG
jgi:DNA-binding NtrC family response regulator